jgi:hypothetical protein
MSFTEAGTVQISVDYPSDNEPPLGSSTATETSAALQVLFPCQVEEVAPAASLRYMRDGRVSVYPLVDRALVTWSR